MPRKSFDPRVLMLATKASVEIKQVPSLKPRPLPAPDFGPDADPSWAWCDGVLVATYGGMTVEVTAEGLSYANERAWTRSESYVDTYARALDKLIKRIDHVAEAAADLGAKADA